MKYVRTEDQIEEVLKEEGELIFTKHGYISRDMVIKESHNIEELFDCFVDHDCEYDTFLVTNDSTLRFNHEIYGSIWTKWGLKYVRKFSALGGKQNG